MHRPGPIQYLRHTQIDKAKWDALVHRSSDQCIYACSWVLDIVCDEWDALVAGDYEAVLPLPVRKKWNIRYVYQPPFIQYLPLVKLPGMDEDIITAFFTELSRSASWVKANFNVVPPANTTISPQIEKRTNLILPIPDNPSLMPYRKKKDIQKNLRKAEGCSLTKEVTVADVVKFYEEAYGRKYWSDSRSKALLAQLITTAENRNACELYGVKDETGQLLFAAALLLSGNRLIYMTGAPNKEGREKSATHFFIDAIISRYAGQQKIFDFEGSDIPSVASFYRKFSPQEEHYYQVLINRLPWPVRLLKRK